MSLLIDDLAVDPTAASIPGVPGYYASPTGCIYNARGKRLSGYLCKSTGYLTYGLTVKGKRTTFSLHKLLALTFVPLPYGYTVDDVLFISRGNRPLVVDHIDGDRLNNNIKNLRWCTQFDNVSNPNSKKQGAPIGNSNAKGHKPGLHPVRKYIYTYDNKDYDINELCAATGWSKSKVTESFRHNGMGLVKQGRLKRRPYEGKMKYKGGDN